MYSRRDQILCLYKSIIRLFFTSKYQDSQVRRDFALFIMQNVENSDLFFQPSSPLISTSSSLSSSAFFISILAGPVLAIEMPPAVTHRKYSDLK